MNNYYAIRIGETILPDDTADLFAAFLADVGFESFQNESSGFVAYVKEELYDPQAIKDIIAGFPIPGRYPFDVEMIEGQDWNKVWEQNYFKPIVIDNQVVIRSTFHNDAPTAKYEILIDPKMAFGTGHHATTSMMVSHLLDNEIEGKTVIDMGTGTGILAILATKLGAASATGIEIDPMAYENTLENGRLNDSEATFICGDAKALATVAQCDIFLANINRNVILQDIEQYSDRIKSGGRLYLSGFYPRDIAMLTEAAAKHGLRLISEKRQGEWASIALAKE